MLASTTARCPVCHRQAPLEIAGRDLVVLLAAHDAGSRRCSGSGLDPKVQIRAAKDIARAVVREMRRAADERISAQIGDHPDREAVLNPTAEQVRARLEVHVFTVADRCAFMVLGDEAAIAEYMHKPGEPETINEAEKAKLLRAAERT